jgi:cytochrome P450
MRAGKPAASEGEGMEDERNDLVWGDDVQERWESFRRGPAVRRFRDGHPLMVSPTAVDHYLHEPVLVSSNPDAVFLGSETGLIPLQIDPPDHVRYRRLLDPLFTPPKMARLEAEVAALVNRHIDSFIGRGSCDLASELAVPIPCGTFLRLLGLPLERLDEFIVMKDELIRPVASEKEDADAIRTRAGVAVFDMFRQALEQRADQPTDDVVGHLVRLEQSGQLTREESLNICLLQLTAGLDTVTASLECFFSYLARSPGHQSQLVEQPGCTAKAVEELLRWMSPVPTVARVFTADADVEGCPVRAGTQMSMLLASTNIDPGRFERPTEVDFSRPSIKHLAFGLGVHRCLGSHLARMELRVVLAEWHRRIPSYRLPEGFAPTYSPAIREIAYLPLEFEPGVRAHVPVA